MSYPDTRVCYLIEMRMGIKNMNICNLIIRRLRANLGMTVMVGYGDVQVVTPFFDPPISASRFYFTACLLNAHWLSKEYSDIQL